MGGRRRKSKKTTRRHRKMKGGMGYGFQGAMGTNGPAWGSSWGGEVSKTTGEPIFDSGARTGGRRRKSKKTTRRRKTMKGGATWQSPGQVGYGYTGQGARGLADPTGYASRVPPSGAPSQNADGAYHV
jgi:hypothetical protein